MPRFASRGRPRADPGFRLKAAEGADSRGAGAAVAWLCLVLFTACSSDLGGGAENRPATGTRAELDNPNTAAQSNGEESEPFAYKATIAGPDDEALVSLLGESSQLIALEDKPPETLAGLERRARQDLERLRETLRSEGYYGAQVDYAIDQESKPIAVTLEVDSGPQYQLAEYAIEYVGADPPAAAEQPSLKDLGIKIDGPARAPEVLAAQQRLTDLLGDRGYPLAKVEDRKTFVQQATRTMTVQVKVDAGPLARFGPLTITGADDVEDEYLQRLVTWKEGARYDRREVEITRRAVTNTDLFSTVQLRPASEVDESGELPLTLTVAQRPQRSVGAGVSYSTDIGFGAEIFWEHRNLFGANERLNLSLSGSKVEQKAEAAFRKPAYLRPDQSLLASFTVANENSDAYDGQTATAYLGFERSVLENWVATAGVSLNYDDLEDNKGTQQYWLVGLPLTGVRDKRDDRLNPTRGTRLDLRVTPYAGTRDDSGISFLVSQAEGSAYHAVDSARKLVLAGRVKAGSIVGENRNLIPASKRFYAGGGGSIRGYEYQKVGPLDADNDPIGGRSLFEVSGEMRYRIDEDWGAVAFVDGGNVFDGVLPDFQRQIRWASGVGVRYFTGFGPLRADIAFPLNGRSDVDDTFQFYVSFGQAF